jgi:hypothetical protein
VFFGVDIRFKLTFFRIDTINFSPPSAYFDISRCLNGQGVAMTRLASTRLSQVTVLLSVPLVHTPSVTFLTAGIRHRNI